MFKSTTARRQNQRQTVFTRCIESLETRRLFAAYLGLLNQPTETTAGETISPAIRVAVRNTDGTVDKTNSSNVTIAITDAAPRGSVLKGTLTAKAVKGIATFANLSIEMSGETYKLNATDGDLTDVTSSQFTIDAAAASKLVVDDSDDTAKAGTFMSDTMVNIEDQFGNIVNTDTSDVSIAIATGPSGAVLNGQTTVQAFHGVADFGGLSLETAGDYTFTVTSGTKTVTVPTTTITAGDAAQVVVSTAPVGTKAGTTLAAIKAQVQDQFGNVVTNNTSNVVMSLASGPGGGAIAGTKTVKAVAGVSTFGDIAFNTAGDYTLNFADSGLTGATSTSFTITAGTASKLVIKTGPTTTAAGASVSPVVVAVTDEFGNVVTTDTTKLTAAVSTGPDGAAVGGTVTATPVKGLATFSGLTFVKSGSYKLGFSGGTLAAATSGTFAVTAGAASKLVFGQGPTAAVAGVALSPTMTVQVQDKLGNVVTSDTSTVTLGILTGPDTGSGTATAVAGVATFTGVEFDKAGAYTLKATDGALTAATSGSFVISPAAASQLVFGKIAGTAVAGASLGAITVSVTDDFGNVIVGDTSTVTIAVHDGTGADGATLGGTLTAAAVKGVATFGNLTLDLVASNYKLDASDGDLDGDTSTVVAVTPGAAAKLVYRKGPTDAKAGAKISPAVTVLVEDKFGNIVTTDTSKITLATASGPSSKPKPSSGKSKPKVSGSNAPATLGGTTTIAAVNGLATFTDLTLTTAGAYTLVASDAKLTTATSSTFAITAGSAAQVAFGTAPSTTTAGATMTAVTAQVQDAFGNAVTGNTSTVTLVVKTKPDGAQAAGTLVKDAVAGVATFDNLVFNTAGTYTFGLTDGGLTGATSGNVTINVGAASKMVVVSQPRSGTVGTLGAFTVAVTDAFGNAVTTDKSKITASLAGDSVDQKLLTGTLTATVANGVATFGALNVNIAGDYQLKFTDGSLTGGSTDHTVLTAGPATQLVYGNVSNNSTAGAGMDAFTVSVEDKFGNVVTSDTSRITISSGKTPTGVKAGSLIAMHATAGVAQFFGVAFSKAGAYTLVATDGKLTSATSGTVTNYAARADRLVYSVQPKDSVAGVKIAPAVVVQITDVYGNLINDSSSNVILSVSGGADIGGTLTQKAVGGVATFNDLVENTAGTFRLNANVTNLLGARSTAFKVTPGAASQLVIDDAPDDTTAGDTLDPVTVDVTDKFGNLVTTDVSKVTVAVGTPKGGTLGGTLTVTAVGGVATFSDLAPKTSGSNTLTFSDGKLTTDTSDAFTVTADAAAKVVFSASPATAKSGAALTAVTAKVVDQFGNLVTTDTSDITIALKTGPTNGAMDGTFTQTAVAGVATFDDLTFDLAGTYTVNITDGDLTGSTSGNFDITAGTAAKVSFKQAPTGAVSGAAINPAVVAQITDAAGNVVTTDTSKVTIAIKTGPTGAAITGTATVTAVKGIATFTGLSLATASDYKFTITDGSLTAADSSTFTITAGAAAKLVITQGPTAAAHGDVVDPELTVEVRDKNGNLVATDTSDITIAIATGPTGGTLGGTLKQTAVAGESTFDDLTFSKAGTYTLKFTDGSLTLATSDTVVIS